MADINITDSLTDETVAITLDEMRPELYDQVTRLSPLLNDLEMGPFKEQRNGGFRIRTPLLVGKNKTLKSFTKGTTMTPEHVPLLSFCYWNYRQMAGNVLIDWVEERENAGSGNIIDLLKTRVDALISGVREDMNEMLWTSTIGSNGLDANGMQFLIPADPRTGVTAGLDRALHYWWRNHYWDNTALSHAPHPYDSGLGAPSNVGAFGTISTGISAAIPIMRTMMMNILHGESKESIRIYTTQLVYEYFLNSQQHMKNFRIAYANSDDTVQWNFGNALFDGIPIQYDPINAPSGEMRFVNLKYHKLVSDSGAWFTFTEERHPYNQFAKVRFLMLRGQQINFNPHKHAALQGITDWA